MTASNFDFLKKDWSFLHSEAVNAEKNVYRQPRAACFYARFTLELAVNWLYDHDNYLRRPYEDRLGALVHEPTFKKNLRPGLFAKVRVILTNGNFAAHREGQIAKQDAFQSVKELFHVLYWLARYYSPGGQTLPAQKFNLNAIPPHEDVERDLRAAEIQKLQEQLEAKHAALLGSQQALEATQEERDRLAQERQQLLAEIAAIKEQNLQRPDDHDYDEQETRDYFIDLMLREAGWTLSRREDREFEVSGMPSNSGKGRVDYVLWGDDGKPLGLVEAKRTKKSPKIGQQQAKLYADCLEKQFGQRPVIFYSNGYETYLWDDAGGYPPRQVAGFYKKSELEYLIHQRTQRTPLGKHRINSAISGRPYQVEAIRRVTETVEQRQRQVLLVMATGTGKTRTAISLIDVLIRGGWIKRVLFLADRNALVNQAINAFKAHLPTVTAINLVRDKENVEARVVCSTYPTMMNMIDETRDGARLFSPGHFDLIIIDEAHRSVYHKYRSIFEYFDTLLIGLTATPRAEADRDTYALFGLEPGMPTFYYELEQAVADGFLVPPRAFEVPIKFNQEGVKYRDLSPDEQAEYELAFSDPDTGEIPDAISGAALNQWLFNQDTVDKVLQHLMENGLRVHDGDRLGKTIIFARNHHHAEFIQERFDANYPHLAGQFARVIDSHDPYAQSLLEDFSVRDGMPVIAVSVDMLDTGVDVPEVLNLVFFKPVRSKTKFHQMIGRGTRLCDDLLGPGRDKEHFYIFDFCDNFAFFDQYPEGVTSGVPDSLRSRTFRTRLLLASELEHDDTPGSADVRRQMLNAAHEHVAQMNVDNFLVRPHRELIDVFKDRDQWELLTDDDRDELVAKLSRLPSEREEDDIDARRFDHLVLSLELALLKSDATYPKLESRVRDIAHELEGKASIPLVAAQLDLLQEAQHDAFWQDVTLPMLEDLRMRLRLLAKFLDEQKQHIVYTNFQDQMGLVSEVKVEAAECGESIAQYRRRVERFVHDHAHHIAIQKVKTNQPLTATDIESLERILFTDEGAVSPDMLATHYPDGTAALGTFIRRLVGLDRQAAKAAFSEYLDNSTFSADQIKFIDTIIDHLTRNGTMEPRLLWDSPFTDQHSEGVSGLFGDQETKHLVAIIKSINANATPLAS